MKPKIRILLIISAIMLSFSACSSVQPEQPMTAAVEPSLVSLKENLTVGSSLNPHYAAFNYATQKGGSNYTFRSSNQEKKEVEILGRALLDEYSVQYDQNIRFPYKGDVFESSGAYAITSVQEAREKYPEWPIPEKLGKYKFVDMTIIHKQTRFVFPGELPRPTNKIVVSTVKPPRSYYLCYENNDIKFRLSVLSFKGEDEAKEADAFLTNAIEMSSLPGFYGDGEIPIDEDANEFEYNYFLIPLESDTDTDYVVQVIMMSKYVDCLNHIDYKMELPLFSKKEALYLRDALEKDFLDK